MTDAVPPPGWYRDPDRPDHERRWDGEGWTGPSHRQPFPNPYGDDYARSMWAAANPVLLRGSVLLLISTIVLAVAAVAFVLLLRPIPEWDLSVSALKAVGLIAVPFPLVLAPAALPHLVIGLDRSDRLGGRRLATRGIGSACAEIVLALMFGITFLLH